MSFGKKLSDLLQKDVGDIFSSDAVKEVASFLNRDIGDIVREKNAREILERIQENSGNLELYHSLAKIYVQKNEVDRAVKIYEGVARRQMKTEDVRDAEKFLARGIDVTAGNGYLLMLYGDLLMKLKETDTAVDYYERALTWHMKRKNPSPAVYLLQRLEGFGRTDISQKIILVSLLMGEKMFDGARAVLSQFDVPNMKVPPQKKVVLLRYDYILNKSEKTICALADFYVKTGGYENAEKIIRRELKRNMSFDGKIRLMKKLGLSYQRRKKNKLAARTYKNIGATLKQTGDMILSRKYFRKAKMLTPHDTEILMELGEDDTISEYVENKIESYSADPLSDRDEE